MSALNNLADKISVGQKNVKVAERESNIAIVDGLIRRYFVKGDVSALSHGPGAIFDFENSLRRSRTETPRYEFKQGFVRLDEKRNIDERLLDELPAYVAALANVGPDADGYLYIGVTDCDVDARRIRKIDQIDPVKLEHLYIVGVDREAAALGITLDAYVQKVAAKLSDSGLSEPLKTQALSALDVVTYKGHSVIRLRVPRQRKVSFVGDSAFMRQGSSLKTASGPQLLALAENFK